MLKLHELRVEKKISQGEAAKALNITQQALSRYERGERELGYAALIKFANYFDVSVDYLLGNSTYFYPDAVKKGAPELSDDERELLRLFRALPPEYQELALTNLRTWTGEGKHSQKKKA